MLSQTFLHLINVSVMASWLVLAIVLFRLVFKKAPKYITCALWALVAIRLIFPISIESPTSLIPSEETIPLEIEYSQNPTIDTGINSLNIAINPIIQDNFTPPDGLTSMNPIQLPIYIGAYLWQMGIVAMVLYALISYIRIKFKVRERVKTEKNIYICDRIPSPFILGIIRPSIYLPSHLSEEDTAFVIAHEKAHIKRLDFIWKPLGYILLTIYWFNPCLWLGYILLCRDIEYACDEKVIKDLTLTDKKIYSETLLNLSIHRPYVTACPLAFGESGVKSRIKSVLNYKKPAFWVTLVAIVLCVVMAVCFLTNPVTSDNIKTEYYSAFTDNNDSYLAIELVPKYGTYWIYQKNVTSCRPQGTYINNANTLTLSSYNNKTYVFTSQDDSIIFNAEKSDTLYSDRLDQIPIPDKTVFKKSNEFPTLSAFSETPDTTLKDRLQDDVFNEYTNDYIGKYTFGEIWRNITNEISPSRIYNFTIYDDNGLKAHLSIDGYQTLIDYICDVRITDKGATLYLAEYSGSTSRSHSIGTELLSIKRTEEGIITTWSAIQPVLSENIENPYCFESSNS